ncbi:hypothetical protein G7Z17_g13678 [Cylindrodendrum hubeiense]|uniref:DUF7896 domain-containing protein n=1 Tax=Cylindrodendrum hubeiense TaxID=595255 RepID=A0A9P5GZH6_9HYPO|nr:hypothetical protein G7Z17_g13678 [Cylindrodendrum hubeiense]
MNLSSEATVEELNRRLQDAEARNAQLEKLIQDQHNTVDPSTLSPVNGDFPLAHGVYQLPNYAVPSSRSNMLSRSKSTISYPTQMAPSMMDRGVGYHAHKRQRRAFSQQSGTASTMMSRSISNRSESNMPFRQTGPVAPLANPAVTPLDRFCASHDEPANQSLQGGLSQRLPSVEENTPLFGIGLDPKDFLERWGEHGSEPYDSMPNTLPNDAFNFQIPSACPSMISGSSAAETTSPLTRQNSSFDNLAATDMARFASSQSQGADAFLSQDSLFSLNAANGVYPGTKRHGHEQVLFGLGASLPPTTPHEYASSAPNGHSFLSSPNMERSISNTSCASAKSTASTLERRAKDARERIIQQAKSTAIAPRPEESPAESNTGPTASKRDPKIPVKQSNYQRPKHPKVFCDQCQDHPEGFRGDHELRRHVNAKHEGIVKKFICRDPADVGLVSKVQAINPLSKCKACVTGKLYGAYYNAAAHLRRTHFKPKTPRGKNKNNDERRGGKGGGDWPAMSDLKLWFEEKHVKVDQQDALSPDQDDADAEMADIEIPDVAVNTQMGMFSHIGSSMSPFDMEASYDLTVDGASDANAMMGVAAGMGMTAPISSASGGFGYSPYSDGSPIGLDGGDYAFSEQGASVYGTNLSSSNTITPSTFQEISLNDAMWGAV